MRIRNQLQLLLGGVALLLAAGKVSAQVGDISNVNYPGWIPSDRVRPVVTVDAAFDKDVGLWRYAYTVANAAGAEQEIRKFSLGFATPAAQTAAPAGWWSIFFDSSSGLPGVTFAAESPDAVGETLLPSEAQIPAGQSLSGFTVVSPYPPGYARTYVQGFAPVPYLPEGWDEPTSTPHDTTNAQRGWSIGPVRYAEVITDGNRRPAVDGFLGFMNLSESGTVLRDPAAIALKLSVAGETVFRETFTATLNGVDVTMHFHPGPADGASLVALFHVGGSSPLQAGKNVLITSVEGLVPGTTRQASDTDRIVFEVQP